jgi:hypothetical protein
MESRTDRLRSPAPLAVHASNEVRMRFRCDHSLSGSNRRSPYGVSLRHNGLSRINYGTEDLIGQSLSAGLPRLSSGQEHGVCRSSGKSKEVRQNSHE